MLTHVLEAAIIEKGDLEEGEHIIKICGDLKW